MTLKRNGELEPHIPQYVEHYTCSNGHSWPSRWRIDVPTQKRESACRACDDGRLYSPLKGHQRLEHQGIWCETCGRVAAHLVLVDYRGSDGYEGWSCEGCDTRSDLVGHEAQRLRLMAYPRPTKGGRPVLGLNRR